MSCVEAVGRTAGYAPRVKRAGRPRVRGEVCAASPPRFRPTGRALVCECAGRGCMVCARAGARGRRPRRMCALGARWVRVGCACGPLTRAEVARGRPERKRREGEAPLDHRVKWQVCHAPGARWVDAV
eukprot:2241930-Prymnesium_polylepis.3